jgi:ATP-binding cassette subfamily A (ABC1) protein 3
VEKDIGKVVDKLIEQLTLGKHAAKEAKNLSGGNRRKLSTGIALIGNPSVIFLDEPTTGMDPVARRLLWNTLSAVRDSGRTLILTSHSMEECEALCTRLAVMVNGRFQCLGSPQHLKTKFSDGYSLIIKVRTTGSDSSAATTLSQEMSSLQAKMRQVMEFVNDKFPGSQLKDQHDGLLHYRVLNTGGLTWAYVFGAIERAREGLYIEDYSVSQTTLEQIFISFARLQREPQEIQSTSCTKACTRRLCGCCRDDSSDDDEAL